MFVEAQEYIRALLYTDTYSSYNYTASYIIANLGLTQLVKLSCCQLWNKWLASYILYL